MFVLDYRLHEHSTHPYVVKYFYVKRKLLRSFVFIPVLGAYYAGPGKGLK